MVKIFIVIETIANLLFFDYVVRQYSRIERLSYKNSIKKIFKGLVNLIKGDYHE